MKQRNPLMLYVQSFFQEYLNVHRGLSPNTILAYRDAIKLYLGFVASTRGGKVVRLTLEYLTSEVTLLFLKQIEDVRKNSAITRNLRLAALRTFFLYLSSQDPLRIEEYRRIIAIPLKRAPRRLMGYLESAEVQAILKSISRTQAAGERDYVLLNLLYNTGARVQEICDLRVESIHLGTSGVATITGKGTKTRHVPLWPETTKLLSDYLVATGLIKQPQSKIFLNARGEPLSRFGIRHIIQNRIRKVSTSCPSLAKKKVGPHTFRHTTAMHLLQAGVDLSVIKSWLGHVSLSTTHAYVEIDLEMKRKALATCKPLGKPRQELQQLLEQNRNVIQWLESLGT